MPESDPYLSLVVTARNDNHGGDLLHRMQIFTSGWIAQARRFNLPSELIVVEWNPVAGNPKLWEVLQWPEDCGPCEVRFIEVPAELHARYPHGSALPLYQMIAKNVGIRRARGKFVLATNIDILFNDELVEFLARQQLDPQRMYRIDRSDAMSDVPASAGIEDQLAYCASHLLRINAREGTFPVTPEGNRTLARQDIAEGGSGFYFGRGWFPPERWTEIFRWLDQEAELGFALPEKEWPAIALEVEPGPGAGESPVRLEIFNQETRLAAVEVKTRCELSIPMASLAGAGTLRLRVSGACLPCATDPRVLNLRVLSCRWKRQVEASQSKPDAPAPGLQAAPPEPVKLEVTVVAQSKLHRAVDAWRRVQALTHRFATEGPHVTITVPDRFRRMTQSYIQWGGVTGWTRHLPSHVTRAMRFRRRAAGRGDIFDSESGVRPGSGWYPREAFRGEIFRWVNCTADILLPPAASNSATLLLQIEPGPGVRHRPFDLLVKNQAGEILGQTRVSRLTFLEIPISRIPNRTEAVSLATNQGGAECPQDARILDFRVFWCGVRQQASPIPETLPQMEASNPQPLDADSLPPIASATAAEALPAPSEEPRSTATHSLERAPEAATPQPSSPTEPANAPEIVAPPASAPQDAHAPAFLHTNGCGDFTLLSREKWFDLRAYPEFDLFSMNIDSVFCYAAHHGGATEELLPAPMRIYHIEHASGSGWTPEGDTKLFERIRAKGLSFVSNTEVVAWAAQMRRLGCPFIFNLDSWGMAEDSLVETRPCESKHQSAQAARESI